MPSSRIHAGQGHQTGFMQNKAIKQDSCWTRPSNRIHAEQGHQAGFMLDKAMKQDFFRKNE